MRNQGPCLCGDPYCPRCFPQAGDDHEPLSYCSKQDCPGHDDDTEVCREEPGDFERGRPEPTHYCEYLYCQGHFSSAERCGQGGGHEVDYTEPRGFSPMAKDFGDTRK